MCHVDDEYYRLQYIQYMWKCPDPSLQFVCRLCFLCVCLNIINHDFDVWWWFFSSFIRFAKKTPARTRLQTGTVLNCKMRADWRKPKKILSMIFSKPALYSSFGFLHVLYLLTLSWLRYLTVKTRQMMYIKESHLNKCS